MVQNKKRIISLILMLTLLVSSLVIGAITVSAEGTVAINIPEFANGTVTADKESYNVGDTVTLTVAPAKDYAQKLYINGEPLLVDTNSKYSFKVEAGKTYDITGEFVYVKGNWYWTAEYIVLNQAHGVFHSPVPAGGEKNGELVPTADQHCGGKVLFKDPSYGAKKDFAIVFHMQFSDGQKVELRLVNKDANGHYMIQSMSGMFGTWKWYYDLNDEENAAVANGEGVWFGLSRYGTDIEITLNGKVIPHRADTPISLAESTVLNQFKVTTYNFSYAIDVKYEFYKTNPVDIKIDSFANGTVTTNKKNYNVGETVNLTINPNSGYAQKLYIDGKPIMLDWNSNVYSFVAEKNSYEITGSFEQILNYKAYDAKRWSVMNLAHGVVTTYYPGNGDSWWFDLNGEYQALEIIAKNYLPLEESMDDQREGSKKDGYHSVIRMTLSNGKTYAFRLYNDKGTYAVSCTQVSGSVTGWGNWKNVANLLGYSINDAMAGDGVKFKVERTSADTLTISVNGVTMFTYKMDGVTEADKVVAVGFQSNRNTGKYVDIPFELTKACNHTWVNATCTAPMTCSTCGMTMGEKLGHSFINYESNNDATCCEDGTKTAKCENCDATDTQVDVGSSNMVDCPEEFWGEWDVISPATCTEVGERIKQCQVINKSTGEICGALVAHEEIPVIPHAEYAECPHTAEDAEGNLYGSVVEALSNGVSVTLVNNETVEELVINGAVLDLGGYTLTTKATIVFNGQIKGAGFLVVDKGNFSISDNATLAEVPVKYAETETTETYIFRVATTLTAEAPAGKDYLFRPTLSGYGITNNDIFCGSVNNNLVLKLRVTRTSVETGLADDPVLVTIPDSVVREVYAKTSTGFAVAITGENAAYTYSVEFVIVSCGVEVYSAPIAYVPKANEEE